ncbi:MAG: PPC domain-containing protein [Polyangiaceae bacterium]
MKKIWGVGVLLALNCAPIAGCASNSADEPTEDSDLTGITPAQVVGELSYGVQKSFEHPGGNPAYRGVTFRGRAGDAVDIWVRSATGDPVTYLLRSGKTLFKNDDASPSDKSSHILGKLPSDGTYTIAFRDKAKRAANFEVDLNPLARCGARVSARVKIPASVNCSVTNEFPNLVSAGKLFAVISPSPTSCDHQVKFVTESGIDYGGVLLQSGNPDSGTFYATGKMGNNGDEEILVCSGRMDAHFLALGCPASNCSMVLNY